MAEWQAVGRHDMLDDGTMQSIDIEGTSILLVRQDGSYRAYQERCPHRRAHLAEGTLANGVITCPWHGSQFDAATGRNLAWVAKLPGLVIPFVKLFSPPENLTAYSVQIDEGQVWVNVSQTNSNAEAQIAF